MEFRYIVPEWAIDAMRQMAAEIERKRRKEQPDTPVQPELSEGEIRQQLIRWMLAPVRLYLQRKIVEREQERVEEVVAQEMAKYRDEGDPTDGKHV